MGTEALRAAVEADGRARVDAILRSAQEEAARVRADATSLTSGRQQVALREEETRLRREGNRRIATVRAEARKRALEAREALLDRVFAAARDALGEALDAPEARSELVARALRALSHMPDGPVVVSCSSDVAPVLEAALAERAGVRIESDPALGVGFRVTSDDAALVVDATLANLLEMDRAALAIAILQRLEGDEDGRAGT